MERWSSLRSWSRRWRRSPRRASDARSERTTRRACSVLRLDQDALEEVCDPQRRGPPPHVLEVEALSQNPEHSGDIPQLKVGPFAALAVAGQLLHDEILGAADPR